jgi:hypothetical protein
VRIEAPGDVGQLADRLTAAALYIGNDSGVTHVAGRMGVPTLAIFGATDPRRWRPRGPRVIVLGGPGDWPSTVTVIDSARELLTPPIIGGSAGISGSDASGPR